MVPDALRRGVAGTVAVFVLALVGILAGCGTTTSAAEQPCAKALLKDWSDGRIDGVYPQVCYLAAIRALPEDLRDYSSAADDLSRALQQRQVSAVRGVDAAPRRLSNVQSDATAPASGRTLRHPVPVALVGGAGLMVVAGGLAAPIVRRLRRRA